MNNLSEAQLRDLETAREVADARGEDLLDTEEDEEDESFPETWLIEGVEDELHDTVVFKADHAALRGLVDCFNRARPLSVDGRSVLQLSLVVAAGEATLVCYRELQARRVPFSQRTEKKRRR